ncbi:MAG: hypothetical protein M1836_001320 [Candelina mexicana]|nr:MAG: hypothetical protein M1836_001320 [Candelina mexicana]
MFCVRVTPANRGHPAHEAAKSTPMPASKKDIEDEVMKALDRAEKEKEKEKQKERQLEQRIKAMIAQQQQQQQQQKPKEVAVEKKKEPEFGGSRRGAHDYTVERNMRRRERARRRSRDFEDDLTVVPARARERAYFVKDPPLASSPVVGYHEAFYPPPRGRRRSSTSTVSRSSQGTRDKISAMYKHVLEWDREKESRALLNDFVYAVRDGRHQRQLP